MNKISIYTLVSFLLLAFSQVALLTCVGDLPGSCLHAEETPSGVTWKEEFTKISSKTTISMTLTTEELQGLVERCDNLLPIIEGLEETPRKIYLKRVKKMKSLFDFVIESRKEVPNK